LDTGFIAPLPKEEDDPMYGCDPIEELPVDVFDVYGTRVFSYLLSAVELDGLNREPSAWSK
jgi:hypothetical protein